MKKIVIPLVLLFFCIVAYNYCTISSDSPNCKQLVDNFILNKHKVVNGNVILIDYSKPSCEDRLYIYNIDTEEVVYSGCVLHGSGPGNTPSQPCFSNQIGSRCSSLGVCRTAEISKLHNGLPCIRLDGLSETNSNMRVRGITIHPSIMASLLPFEIKGFNFPLTKSCEGCLTVSYHTFYRIKQALKEYENKEIYIYSYN